MGALMRGIVAPDEKGYWRDFLEWVSPRLKQRREIREAAAAAKAVREEAGARLLMMETRSSELETLLTRCRVVQARFSELVAAEASASLDELRAAAEVVEAETAVLTTEFAVIKSLDAADEKFIRGALQFTGAVTEVRPPSLGRLRSPPGHRLLGFAELFFSRKAYEEVLAPTVEDMRLEYNEALKAGRPRKAALVRFRGTWAFLQAAGLVKVMGLVKSVTRIWTAIG